MDKKIRLLAQNLYVVKKILILFFVTIKRIAKKRHQPSNKKINKLHYFVPFSTKYIFAPLVWRMFDSYSAKDLPTKNFEKWAKSPKNSVFFAKK